MSCQAQDSSSTTTKTQISHASTNSLHHSKLNSCRQPFLANSQAQATTHRFASPMAPKRGRKRDRAETLDGPGDVSTSPLANLLLQYWAWGQLSAPMLQSIALAASRTAEGDYHVQQMARFGTSGRQPQNIQRSIISAYCPDVCAPEPFEIMVPVTLKVNTETVTQELPFHMFLPHEWLFSLTQAGMADEILGIQQLAEFWQGQSADDPKLKLNPSLSGNNSKRVPLMVHGDGGQHQKRDTLMIVSMRSVLTSLPIEKSQMLLAALPKRCRVQSKGTSLSPEEDSWYHIWRVLKWSFTAAFHGVMPNVDHLGQEFPANSRRAQLAGQPIMSHSRNACIWVLAGDQDYQSNEMGLPHSSSNNPCGYCKCGVYQDLFTDFRLTASWRNTQLQPEESRRSPRCSHLVLQVPGVVFEMFHFDAMHCLELGITGHVLANIMFTVVFQDMKQMSRAEAMKQLWSKVLKNYIDLNIPAESRISNLQLKHFCTEGRPHKAYPDLSTAIKARERRYLIPVFLNICEEFRHGTEAKEHRFQAMRYLDRVYRIIDAEEGSEFFHTDQQSRQLEQAIHSFLSHYAVLAKQAVNSSLLLWSIVPKFHYLIHLGQQARFLRSRKSWCYGSESMVGKIILLAASCLAGTPPHQVSIALCDKYRVAMHLSFTQQE